MVICNISNKLQREEINGNLKHKITVSKYNPARVLILLKVVLIADWT